MDSHKVSVLPEHLKVVELGRRRRWSEDEKLRIVMESLVEPGNVSATARRHGISRSLLTVWRRAHKVERVAPESVPTFVPAVVVPEPAAKSEPAPRRRRPRQAAQGRMVIEVGRGRRIVADGAVDAEALACVLDVTAVARQARGFEAVDGADMPRTDVSHEFLKPGAQGQP